MDTGECSVSDENEEENGFVDTEERVRESMDRATNDNLSMDSEDVRVSDISEKKLVDDFVVLFVGARRVQIAHAVACSLMENTSFLFVIPVSSSHMMNWTCF